MKSKTWMQVQHNIPNLWMEGALFAFSGYDGPTHSSSRFVATVGANDYSLLFHTPKQRWLEFKAAFPGTVQIATGDVFLADLEAGPLLAVFQSWHTLVGTAPVTVDMQLRFEEEDGGEVRWKDTLLVTESVDGQDAVVLLRHEERWALAYGSRVEEAAERAVKGMASDIWKEAEDRMKFYRHAPRLEDPLMERLLLKCFSVMKVNTLAAEGVILQHWSTPDRVPHQAMWLWDSVFHTFAMNWVDPVIAWNF